jgi:6-phosphofructokinase 2
VPEDFYARLARLLAVHGVRLVLDTSGPALAAALEAGVHLFKPSLRELETLCGRALPQPAAQLQACRQLIAAGQAQVVALSLGAQGALLVTAGHAWRAPALAVQVASTIGAGDSFVGGLVWALARGELPEGAFRHAMAASAAALLSQGTALAQPDDVVRLLGQVRIADADAAA